MTQYELRLKGRRSLDWSGWFRELQVRTEAGDGAPLPVVVLTGQLPDQSALLGVLMRLHNLNLTILSVQRTGED